MVFREKIKNIYQYKDEFLTFLVYRYRWMADYFGIGRPVVECTQQTKNDTGSKVIRNIFESFSSRSRLN